MRTPNHYIRVLSLFALPLCVAVTGCDDDDDSDATDETTTTSSAEDTSAAEETSGGAEETSGGAEEESGEEEAGEEGADEETEVITTVNLTFTPAAGGDPVTASFQDPDGDGGASGTTDPIVLAAGTQYSLTLQFLNELESPAEDITEEVEETAEEHLVLIYGASVTGPATTNADTAITHAYADVESDYGDNNEGDDLPVGLSNSIETSDPATGGELRVMLRHLPVLNDSIQKTSDIVETFAAGGAIAGDVDVDITFDVTIE